MSTRRPVRFADACGATAPLALVVERADGEPVAAGVLPHPFAVVGRDAGCDLILNDPDVGPRHCFLQVVAGRVFVGDLGGPGGVLWPHGRQAYGWLFPGEPVRVGPFRLTLARPVADRPPPLPAGFHPLARGSAGPLRLPPVAVEFRTGRAAQPCWPVDRVLTLIGRAKGCKIHLAGDDVSAYHAYLLHTPAGLWAVDLLGRGGMRVNGRPVRAARLSHGDELRIGRFTLGCRYRGVRTAAHGVGNEDGSDGVAATRSGARGHPAPQPLPQENAVATPVAVDFPRCSPPLAREVRTLSTLGFSQRF